MSLKHALLGFIDLIPLSGYDLAKMFDDSVNFYWPATHSQIYRTLKELYQAGMVTREIVRQSEHPNKKVYSITKLGKEELRRWVSTPLDLPTLRHGLLVQLAFANRLADQEIIGLLEAYAEKLRERLALYHGEQQQEQLAYSRTEREKFLWSSILKNGILSYECDLKWAEETIRDLQRKAWKSEG
jgi:PadR family transcriptional regulator AphA